MSSLILVKLLLNQYLPIALILHNDTPINATKLFVPSVKGQRGLLLHIKIKFHYFTQGMPWIMLFTRILTFSLNHSMFIVSCKVLSCTSMSMPRTIVIITHTKHNMKIPSMEHHIQTRKWFHLNENKNLNPTLAQTKIQKLIACTKHIKIIGECATISNHQN